MTSPRGRVGRPPGRKNNKTIVREQKKQAEARAARLARGRADQQKHAADARAARCARLRAILNDEELPGAPPSPVLDGVGHTEFQFSLSLGSDCPDSRAGAMDRGGDGGDASDSGGFDIFADVCGVGPSTLCPAPRPLQVDAVDFTAGLSLSPLPSSPDPGTHLSSLSSCCHDIASFSRWCFRLILLPRLFYIFFLYSNFFLCFLYY